MYNKTFNFIAPRPIFQNSAGHISAVAAPCDNYIGRDSSHDLLNSPLNNNLPSVSNAMAHCGGMRHLDMSAASSTSQQLSAFRDQAMAAHTHIAQRLSPGSLPQHLMRSFSEPHGAQMQTGAGTSPQSALSHHNGLNSPPCHVVSPPPPPQFSGHHQAPPLMMPPSFTPSVHVSPTPAVFPGQSVVPGQHHFLPEPGADQFDVEQVPSGPYQPELTVSDNPHYFSVNQMLYEAHISRSQRHTEFHPPT